MGTLTRLVGGLLLAVAVLLGGAGQSQAMGAGTIEGQVLNGTPGGATPEGISVTLRVVRDGEEISTQEAEAGAEGRFRFEGLETDPALDYWVEATYLDVTYSAAEAARFSGEEQSLPVQVTVYETTDDDSAVRLVSVHLIAESFDQVLRLSEVHLFANDGDRTFVGKPAQAAGGAIATLSIPVPAGAVGLAFEGEEGRFLEVERGALDTQPVIPGSEASVVRFSYHLLVSGESVGLERSFAYPVDLVSALVVQPGLQLSSPQMQGQEPISFEGREFAVLQALDLASGDRLELTFAVQPQSAEVAVGASEAEQAAAPRTSRGSQPTLRWLGALLAALAVVTACAYPVITRRPKASPGRGRSAGGQSPRVRQLLSELAGLEQAFEAGELDEATYEQSRAEKVRALRSAWS